MSLTGDLDLATVPSLREAAAAELNAADCKILVLDLNGLTFVDSTGLGCWIDLRNQAAAGGKELALENVPVLARRTVTIAGLADVFGIPGDDDAPVRGIVGADGASAADETSAT